MVLAIVEARLRVAYINEEGGVVEYKQYVQEQGFLMSECAISSDHTKMALKVRQDHESGTRSVVIWDFESDNHYELSNPVIDGATNVSAIDFNWDGAFLQVNFLVETELGQHNELWQYEY